jgi:hypothetical protein
MSDFGFAVFWAFTGALVTVFILTICNIAGRCSDAERRDADCERCMDAMQERMEQRIREHGNYRYLQGVADQGGPPVDAVMVRQEVAG